MGIFRQFPYTNFHELNMDWLLQKVKEWVAKCEELQLSFNSLSDAFDDLNEYVTNFLDEFVNHENLIVLVHNELERMLEAGELNAIIGNFVIKFDDIHVRELNGRAVMRTRHNYLTDPSQPSTYLQEHTSMQNACVWAPSGNYDRMTSTGLYLYYWEIVIQPTLVNDKVVNVNTAMILHSYDLINFSAGTPLAVTTMAGEAGHGGGLAVKDGYLYSIDYVSQTLFKFDITIPTQPQLYEKTSVAGLNGRNIIGYEPIGNYWLCSSSSGESITTTVYKVNETFTAEDPQPLFNLELSEAIIQDYSYDPLNKRIYSAQTWSNVITCLDGLTGKAIIDYEVPECISYIDTGELEFVDVKNNQMYWGSISQAGGACNILQERVCFFTNPHRMNATRHINYGVGGERTYNIDYYHRTNPNASDYNPWDANGLNRQQHYLGGNNLKFKYVEDAFNAIKEFGGGIVTFMNDYPMSFTVSTSCRLNIEGHRIGTFKTDTNVDIYLTGINSCSFITRPLQYLYTRSPGGTEHKVYQKCCMYIAPGSRCVVNNFEDLDKPASADVLFWVNTATLEPCEGNTVHDTLVTDGCIRGTALIGRNFYSRYSRIECSVDLKYYATQHFDDYSSIIGNVYYDGSRRPKLSDIWGKELPFPIVMHMSTGVALPGGKPFPALELYCGGIGSAQDLDPPPITWGYYSDGGSTFNMVRLKVTKRVTYNSIGVQNYASYRVTEDTGYTIPAGLLTYVGVITAHL